MKLMVGVFKLTVVSFRVLNAKGDLEFDSLAYAIFKKR